jgi:hypothetical protein
MDTAILETMFTGMSIPSYVLVLFCLNSPGTLSARIGSPVEMQTLDFGSICQASDPFW